MEYIDTNYEEIDYEYTEVTDEEILENFQNSSEIFDAVKAYLKEISVYKPLTPTQFKDLFIKYKNGDNNAKKIIIETHLRFVVYIIKKYCHIKSSDSFLDAIQEGNMGLMKALEKYDLSFNATFRTYASYWIRQKVQRESSTSKENIRVPVHVKEKFYKYIKYKTNYYNTNGCYPSDDEIKSYLNINDNQLAIIRHVQDNINNMTSLNSKVNNEDETC